MARYEVRVEKDLAGMKKVAEDNYEKWDTLHTAVNNLETAMAQYQGQLMDQAE
jgi:hypothetical protein